MKLDKKSLSGTKSSCQSSSSQSSSGCGCGSKKGSVYEEDIDVEISE
ncbi:MAG: hypothetical protein J6N45_02565 [Alphaproteobacteria bacterium]|nr:hypothetical protein [Alphaproteobacteria bacterium]